MHQFSHLQVILMKKSNATFIFLLFVLMFFIKAQNKLSPYDVAKYAVEYNYDLMIAKNNIIIAKNNNNLGLGVGNPFSNISAGNSFLPQISITGGTAQNPLGIGRSKSRQEYANPAFNVNNQINNNTYFAPSLNMTWYLFDGLKMFATKNKLSEIEVLSNLQYRQMLENTLISALSLYYQIVSVKEYIKYLNAVKEVLIFQNKLAEDKLKIGIASETDVLQSKIDLNNIQSQIIQQQGMMRQYKANLNNLIGKNPDEDFDVIDTIYFEIEPNFQSVAAMIDKQSTSVMIAQQNSAIDQLILKEYKASRLPKIGITGSYNFSRSTNTIGLMRLTQSVGYAFGFTFSVNILNHLATHTAIKNQRIILMSDKLKQNSSSLLEKTNLFNAYVAFENWMNILNLYKENLFLAKKNLEMNAIKYQKGNLDYISLKISEETYESVLYNHFSASLNAKINELNFLKSAGLLTDIYLKKN